MLAPAELDPIVGTYTAGSARAEISARDGHAYLAYRVADKLVWEGPLVATPEPRAFAGGPGGPDPDYLARFLPATGKATAVAVGHRLLLDNLLRAE